ncbi:MAG: DMT family transporter [Breznakibacter sp.]|nr:DMT family transporter [Breznakibacter sp.]
MSQHSAYTKSIFALFIGVFFTGISGIFIKSAAAPGAVTAFYRMAIGAFVLTPLFLYQLSNQKFILNREGIKYALIAGLCFGGDMVLWATGITISNATLPTIMGNLAPLWVGLIALAFLKERLKWHFWTGVLLATIGVFVIVHKNIGNADNVLLGILLGAGAGLFYAVFYVVTQIGRKHIDTIPFLYLSTLGSAVVLAIYNLLAGNELLGYSNDTYFLFVVYGIGVQVVGWMFINYAQGYVKATIVSTILLGQPLVTAVIAALFLAEVLTVYHYIGSAIVLGGIYVVQISRQKSR